MTEQFNDTSELTILQCFTDHARADSVPFAITEHLDHGDAYLNLLSPGFDVVSVALTILAQGKVASNYYALGFEGGENRFVEKLSRGQGRCFFVKPLDNDAVGAEVLEERMTLCGLSEK
jgi:hypothetical protein